jgi:signal transduction histidine kinase
MQLSAAREPLELGARPGERGVEFFVRGHRRDEAREVAPRARTAAGVAAVIAQGIVEAHGGRLWRDGITSVFSLA